MRGVEHGKSPVVPPSRCHFRRRAGISSVRFGGGESLRKSACSSNRSEPPQLARSRAWALVWPARMGIKAAALALPICRRSEPRGSKPSSGIAPMEPPPVQRSPTASIHGLLRRAITIMDRSDCSESLSSLPSACSVAPSVKRSVTKPGRWQCPRCSPVKMPHTAASHRPTISISQKAPGVPLKSRRATGN